MGLINPSPPRILGDYPPPLNPRGIVTLFTFASETRVAFHRRPSRYILIGDHKLAIKGRQKCHPIRDLKIFSSDRRPQTFI